jgi:hypothetical protein
MSVSDEVFCNNDLFGEQIGEKHLTQSLDAVFPGSVYEITPDGRLELLEETFEDRSDPNAQGPMRLAGIMTPVFTGERRDMNFHGWVVFPDFGRADFTEGTLTEFVPDPDSLHEPEFPQYKTAHVEKTLRPEARRIRHQQLHLKSCEMTVLLEGPRRRQPRINPFQRMLEKTHRGLDDTAKTEWLDDTERRLREVISHLDPRPTVDGYSVERSEDGLKIFTITARRIGKRAIGGTFCR